jgi:hypothetical protein
LEQIPQFKIKGLDEAMASLEGLSRAIESVGFSAHVATLELGGTSPIRTPTLPFDDYLARFDPVNRTGALAPFDTSLPELQKLDEAISGLTSALALPQLNGVLGAISEANTSIRDATTALTTAVTAMNKAVADFKLPPIQVFGMSPEQLQVQLGALQAVRQGSLTGLLSRAADAATGAGFSTMLENPVAGSVLVAGGLTAGYALDQLGRNDFYDYDEEAAKHMGNVRGFGDIAQVEDGFFFSRQGTADARSEEFWKQLEFFTDRLKELDDAANVELTPLLDEPAEFFRREQARLLRSLYSQDFLELIDRYKLAVGSDPTKINPGPLGQLASPRIGIDAEAYKIALAHGTETTDQITPAVSSTPVQSPPFQPIKMEIKVLSDYRLSMRTNNPNPGIDVSVDFSCGMNMVGR